MQQSMSNFQEHQEQVNNQLKELITGLSRQVLQIGNTTALNGGVKLTNNGNGSLSRLSKIDFPKFDGSDVQRWIYKCEQFFEVDNTCDNVKVKIVAIHLRGKALLWHQSFIKSRGNEGWPGWHEYRTAILTRLGSGPFDDPLAELMKLRQFRRHLMLY